MEESTSRLFRNWFDFDGFSAWKLQTKWDYILFGLLLLIGFMIFFLITCRMKKNRNPEHARKVVIRKMNRLGGKGAVCYTDKWVSIDNMTEHCDMISVSKDRVFLIKVFHYGLEVVGSVHNSTWEFRDGKKVFYQDNPMPSLEQQKLVVDRLLLRNHLRNIPVEPLIIFADNWGVTQFKIVGLKAKNAVPVRLLRSWRRTYKLDKVPIEKDKVKAALERCFVEAPQEKA